MNDIPMTTVRSCNIPSYRADIFFSFCFILVPDIFYIISEMDHEFDRRDLQLLTGSLFRPVILIEYMSSYF